MRAFVVPGQALEVEATLLHDGSGYAVVRADPRRRASKVAEAEITLSASCRSRMRRCGRRCWKPPAASACRRTSPCRMSAIDARRRLTATP